MAAVEGSGMLCEAQCCDQFICMPAGEYFDTKGAICVQDQIVYLCCHTACTLGGELNKEGYEARQKTYLFEVPCPVDMCKCGIVNPMSPDGIVCLADNNQCLSLCATRTQFPTPMCGGASNYPAVYSAKALPAPDLVLTICCPGLTVYPVQGCCVGAVAGTAAPAAQTMK